MLAYIESGDAKRDGITTVFFWKLNRIARNVMHISRFVHGVGAQGMRLVSLTEDLDPNSKTGRLTLTMISAIDEFFSDSLGEDVVRGMQGAAEEGRWTNGAAPYGYRTVHDVAGRSGRLTVHPAEAEAVRTVFALYESGDGAKSVAAAMTARGVPPPSSGLIRKGDRTCWSRKNVATIVQSPAYAGRIVHHGAVLRDAAHDAIIAPERWERTQALRRSRFRKRTRENSLRAGDQGVFLPWLRCGTCGGAMHVQHGTKERYHYACSLRSENKAACTGVNARTDLLDAILWRVIMEAVLPDDMLTASAQRWRSSFDGEGLRRLHDHRAAIEARIAGADMAIRRAVDLVARGVVAETDIADSIRQQRAARDAARDDLALMPVPLPVPSVTPSDLRAFRYRILAAAAAKPIAERRAGLKRLVSSIVIAPGVATLTYCPRLSERHQPEVAPLGGPNGSW